MSGNSPLSVHFDLLVKLLGIAASVSLAVSLTFDWGFYAALNLSFLEVPTVISDHVRSALIWLPKIVTAFAGIFVFEMLTKRIEQGMTEDEIIQSSSNPDRTKQLRNGPLKLIALISILTVIAYLLMGDIFLGTLPFGLIVIWFMFSMWAQSHPRIIERRPYLLKLAAHFLPPIAIWSFFSGYTDAVRIFQSTPPNFQVILISNATPEHVTLLRQLDKGLLVKEANNIVTFRPWSEIRKIETSGKYIPSKGILCSRFGLTCDQPKSVFSRPCKIHCKPAPSADLSFAVG